MIDLKSMVEKYPECLDSATKLKSYMMDLCPDNSNKARIRILADIVDCGIALEIKNGKTDSISISNFCNTMENQYGYSTKLVEECVNQFLVAFGNIEETYIEDKAKVSFKQDMSKYVCNINDFFIDSAGVLKKYNGKDAFVRIPTNVLSIGQKAFYGCKNIIGVYIPNGVNFIGKYAFYQCSNLEKINIPNSVVSIEMLAFGYCKLLKNLVLPNTITNIGTSAFIDCCSLTDLNFPKALETLGAYAFYSCTSLQSIYFHSEEQKNKFADCFGPKAELIVKAE